MHSSLGRFSPGDILRVPGVVSMSVVLTDLRLPTMPSKHSPGTVEIHPPTVKNHDVRYDSWERRVKKNLRVERCWNTDSWLIVDIIRYNQHVEFECFRQSKKTKQRWCENSYLPALHLRFHPGPPQNWRRETTKNHLWDRKKSRTCLNRVDTSTVLQCDAENACVVQAKWDPFDKKHYAVPDQDVVEGQQEPFSQKSFRKWTEKRQSGKTNETGLVGFKRCWFINPSWFSKLIKIIERFPLINQPPVQLGAGSDL